MKTPTTDSLRSSAEAPARGTHFHQVLILLAAYLLGGGQAPLAERTHDAVGDDARRKAAGAVVDGIEQATKDHLARVVQLRNGFFEVARRHDATAQELDAALGRAATEAERFQRTLLDARSRLKEQVNAKEWKTIFGD